MNAGLRRVLLPIGKVLPPAASAVSLYGFGMAFLFMRSNAEMPWPLLAEVVWKRKRFS